MSAYRVCLKLLEANGRLEKEAVLKDAYSDTEFVAVLRFLLDSDIKTGLQEAKLTKQVYVLPSKEFESLTDVLMYLQKHNTGTDDVIANLQRYIMSQPVEQHEFLEKVLTKTLRLGISTPTANKVYGINFVPKFDCMLAERFFDNIEHVEGREFTLTEKLDGFRCIAIRRNSGVVLYSRTGKVIQGLHEIEDELNRSPWTSFMLDGELIVDNPALASKDQYKATSQIVKRNGKKAGITFHTFDYLPYEELQERKTSMPYVDRRGALESMFSDLRHIQVLPTLYTGSDISMVNTWLNQMVSADREGVMLNLNDASYEFRRCKSLLKVKRMYDLDLPVVGYREGSGRLQGTLGNLIVKYKGGVLGVGSGLDDETRARLWAQRDLLVGQMCTVQYFEETVDANGKPSLRFPVFLRIR